MRKSSLNNTFLILGLLIIIIIFYTINSNKEGFVGKTYILDDFSNVCPNGKKKIGINGKPTPDNNYFDGLTCPSGYGIDYIAYGNESASEKCIKVYVVCDEGYNYNKNVKDDKFCQKIDNKNDRKKTINNIVCPLPADDEVRLIANRFCVIGKIAKPQCKSGFTFDSNILKCYKCV